MIMEPMKRMSITVAVILVIAVLALGAVYMMTKKLGQRVEMRSVFEETGERPPQEEVTMESPETSESLPESETPVPGSPTPDLPAGKPLAEISDAKESTKLESSAPAEQCDIIPPDDISKYLKVKDSVFTVYNENKVLADMMLNQERKWRPEHITNHMWILMEIKVEKKKALKDAELAEKRYHLISNALMEWILRTDEVTYEKKYIGEDDFYRKKIDPIIPCEENDQLFVKNKESILKTFMGDFELVDY
jgi:hypothetical protein